ncbi:MAG: hypothetical protein CVV06_01450 [Gammaproteobacteria bacterium HGW-Gammaproteobacteria-10]|nr:MAG: hypothetical protein CVV06_01450 [Gammaproteobacteria bacterium HGW-Gammaproteobacteria-10]
MTTQNPSNQYTVKIYVNKDSACLAGYDLHGEIERTIKPSELTPRQRQTLVDCKFTLSEHYTGVKIDGTQSVTELLDLAADKIDADKAKEQQRINEAVEILIQRIVDNSAYNPHHIDTRTGRLEIEQGKHALIQITSEKADKTWTHRYFYQSVGSLYFGKEKSIDEIRDRVLAKPEVIERIASLEQVADHIQAQLDRAKEVRDRIAAERKAQAELEQERAAQARKEQLATFVLTHMSELDQKKWLADLLPEAEILFDMADHVFKPLDQFQAVDREALYADAMDYLSEYGGTIQEITREVIALSDEQFMLLEAIKKEVASSMPGATVEPLKLVLYSDNATSDDDPEIEYTVARVSVRRGEFDFRRDFMLPESNGSEEV